MLKLACSISLWLSKEATECKRNFCIAHLPQRPCCSRLSYSLQAPSVGRAGIKAQHAPGHLRLAQYMGPANSHPVAASTASTLTKQIKLTVAHNNFNARRRASVGRSVFRAFCQKSCLPIYHFCPGAKIAVSIIRFATVHR
jgi:hypothetical protein